MWVQYVVLAVALSGCAGLNLGPAAAGVARPPSESAPASSESPAVATREAWDKADGPDLALIVATLDARDERPRRLLREDEFDLSRRPARAPWRVPAVALDGPPQLLLVADGDQPQLVERPPGGPPPIPEIEEYDPWEPFNEAMFEFNRWLDRWIIKPVAKAYNRAMPEPFQQMIGNGFENIRFVPRLVNSLLQGKFEGAGREFGRFLLNSTLGVGGLGDVARREPFNLRKSNEDTGQTLGVWGFGPGPYLVLPFLPPLTVRDAVGYVADGAMDPLSYFVPLIPERLAMKAGDTVNDRSLNLELYQGFEETTVEFYSALRNAYLQRRLKLIKE